MTTSITDLCERLESAIGMARGAMMRAGVNTNERVIIELQAAGIEAAEALSLQEALIAKLREGLEGLTKVRTTTSARLTARQLLSTLPDTIRDEK